jgi:excisionase family DNA binding protein
MPKPGETKPQTAAEKAAKKAAIAAELTRLLKAGNGNAILNKQQAALHVQATTRFLERAVKLGRLKALRPTGKLWRVRLSDLEAFLESGATTNGGGE